ncbi:hypothetical protein D3C74_318950 [compost metagenome]
MEQARDHGRRGGEAPPDQVEGARGHTAVGAAEREREVGQVRVGDAHEHARDHQDDDRPGRAEVEREGHGGQEHATDRDPHGLDRADRVREPMADDQDAEREPDAPRREDEAERDDVEPQEHGRVAQDDEEHEVVGRGHDAQRPEAGLAEEREDLPHVERRGLLGRVLEARDRQRERDDHEQAAREERDAPAELAQQPADERAHREAQAHARLEQAHDPLAVVGEGDEQDHRGREEHRVAQAPQPAQRGELADALREGGEDRRDRDQAHARAEDLLVAEPARRQDGRDHADRHDGDVRGEEQLDLPGGRADLLADDRQDRVDHGDTGDREEGREGGRVDRGLVGLVPGGSGHTSPGVWWVLVRGPLGSAGFTCIMQITTCRIHP